MGHSTNIGLLAGWGTLPFEVVKDIQQRGAVPVIIGLKGEADPELAQRARVAGGHYHEIAVGQLGRVIEIFHENEVAEIVMAGKVGKKALFCAELDEVVQRLLVRLPQKNDDAILLAIVEEFEKNGLPVAKQTAYLSSLLAEAGLKTAPLSSAEESDLQLGFRMAKAMGDLDIGQSVVVKQGVVIAVEAIEGTDQAIVRGGTLGGPGAVVVKVSKPNQDFRFDVPTVGSTTLASMLQAQAAVLGVEANKTFITNRERFFETASQNSIKIVSL